LLLFLFLKTLHEKDDPGLLWLHISPRHWI
jgi:hypothetical protein